MTPSRELARRGVAAQPFSALLGTELNAFDEGAAVLRIVVTEQMLQQHGRVHGGVTSYLVDNATTFAAGTVLGADLETAAITSTMCGQPPGPRSWRGHGSSVSHGLTPSRDATS